MLRIKDYLKLETEDIKKLLCFVLNKEQPFIYTHSDYQLNLIEQNQLNSLIKRRENGEPFAYLIGLQGFYHLDFIVNQYTLIPRPETEKIIDIILELLPKTSQKVLDLGTGSGAIAITLKDKRVNWEIQATDISLEALSIAKKNAQKYHCNIQFIQSSWFEKINSKYNLIVSNPPYIEENDKHLLDLKYEPITALRAKDKGLSDIKIIIKNAIKYLLTDGYLLLEHGFNQQQQVVELLQENYKNIQTFKDFNQVPRCVLAQVK